MASSQTSKYDYLLKYIIIGDSNVGKSNILVQYIYGRFNSEYLPTIGVEFGSKNVKIRDKYYRVQIWDTAGQEFYKSITRAYYKNSACALIVYDISSKETFDNVSSWIEDCSKNASNTINMVLIGNKSDLKDKREVNYEEGHELAEKFGIKFYETSAKTGENIQEIFADSVNDIATKLDEGYYDLQKQDCGIKQGIIDRNISIERINSEISSKHKKKCCK